MFGGIWIGPGSGARPDGDGARPDLGHANAVATVAACLAAGVRDFDTAPWYGAGASEARLGLALEALRAGAGAAPAAALTPSCITAAAAAARVYTKCGRLVRGPDGEPCLAGFTDDGGDSDIEEPPPSARHCVNDFTAAGGRVSLGESLSRLRLDRVHGLRIHDPNDNSNNRCGLPEEARCCPERKGEHGGGRGAQPRLRGPSAGFVDEVALCLTPGTGMCAGLRAMRDGADEGLGAEGGGPAGVAEVSLGMNCNREAHQGAPEEVLRLLRGAPPGTFDSALLAGGWNLLSQAGAPCLAECAARGVAVHLAGAFASGLLAQPSGSKADRTAEERREQAKGGSGVGGSGGNSSSSGNSSGGGGSSSSSGEGVVGTYAYQPADAEKVERAERWSALAEHHGQALPAVALAFAFLPTCVTRVVVGMATPAQVAQNMEWVAASGAVPVALWADARRLGLLSGDFPLPNQTGHVVQGDGPLP